MTRIFLLFFLLLVGCKKEALFNLTEPQSTEVLTMLEKEGISADRKPEGKGFWKILVPEEKIAKALEIVQFHKAKIESSDKVSSISPFASPEERKQNTELLKSSEIEETLRRLPAVHDVRVHLLLPSQGMFGNIESQGSGSVMLLISGEFIVSPDEVAQLVGGATGLEPSKISVVIKTIKEPILLKDQNVEIPSISESSKIVFKQQFDLNRWYIILGVIALLALATKFFRQKQSVLKISDPLRNYSV